MNVLFVFGTRPEAIKLAPVIKEFQNRSSSIACRVCVTAQHRLMLDQCLSFFDISPEYDLNLMRPGQDLFDITSGVLQGLRTVIENDKPDLIVVHGDTTTTLAASLAAYYKRIKLAHVEAGLRTNDIYSPWPEEINRQLASRIADFHFAPTETSRQNLIQEGIDADRIIVTGNTVTDALMLVVDKIENDKKLKSGLAAHLAAKGYNIDDRIESRKRKFVLITGHRRENFGSGFDNICKAINYLARKNSRVDFVFPVHLNPNVRQPVLKRLSGLPNVFLIEPLEYEAFIYLMHRSYLVLTDSGGIQEEAPSLGKPVLVMRNTTERPEAVKAGTVRLVGTDSKKIIQELQQLLDDPFLYERMSRAHNPYGDGRAAIRITDFLSHQSGIRLDQKHPFTTSVVG